MAAFFTVQQRAGKSGIALSSVDHRSARRDRNDQSAAPAQIVPSLSMRVAHSRFHDRPAGTLHSAKDPGRGACLLCLRAELFPCLDGLSSSETTLPVAMSQCSERYGQMSGECRDNRWRLWQLSPSQDGLAFAAGKRRSSVHTSHQGVFLWIR